MQILYKRTLRRSDPHPRDMRLTGSSWVVTRNGRQAKHAVNCSILGGWTLLHRRCQPTWSKHGWKPTDYRRCNWTWLDKSRMLTPSTEVHHALMEPRRNLRLHFFAMKTSPNNSRTNPRTSTSNATALSCPFDRALSELKRSFHPCRIVLFTTPGAYTQI